jgi:hypothetical protein
MLQMGFEAAAAYTTGQVFNETMGLRLRGMPLVFLSWEDTADTLGLNLLDVVDQKQKQTDNVPGVARNIHIRDMTRYGPLCASPDGDRWSAPVPAAGWRVMESAVRRVVTRCARVR